MTSILEKIAAYKRNEVRKLSKEVSFSELARMARDASPTRGFTKKLGERSENGYGIIAEIKKASPSKGLIRDDFEPSELASAYEAGGAACISVLTDSPSFQGSPDHLGQARQAATIPLIRKDFMIDPYQIFESRLLGADCILIILAMVDDFLAKELKSAAAESDLDVLIEVHSEHEVERALNLGSAMIGINNRDLNTFRVDIETTVRLAPRIPTDRTIVSESGIWAPTHLARLADVGVRNFLVGESLMRKKNVARALKELLADAG